MLRAYKKDKIILLTTHYMDEADILGDRIGIMTQGKMTCLGSSMFLKNRFGVGYCMTIVKKTPEKNNKIMPYLHERLGPTISLLTEIRGEMSVQIPRECTTSFKEFFGDFDNDLEMLDIQSYGMSVTTLEQVFLEIGHDPNPKPKMLSSSASGSGDNQMQMNTPSADGNSVPDLSSALTKGAVRGRTPLDATDNEDVSRPNSDRRLVSNTKAGSFLPDIVNPKSQNDGMDNLVNADVSNIGGREDSMHPFDPQHGIQEE